MDKQATSKEPVSLKYLDAQIIESGQIEDWVQAWFSFHARRPGGNRIGISVTLHMILSQMAEVYPARAHENPDGTVWDGLVLPDRLLAYSKFEDRGNLDFARGNLLDIATEHGATDDAIRMLIASGFSPQAFSRKVGMTPIGKAAHGANVSALRLFAQAGFDLSLPMTREHTSGIEMVDSNLLHRLITKAGIDSPEGVEVVEVLLNSGVDPFAANAEGKTPFEMAHGNIRVAMEQWLARQHSKALEEGVDPSTQEGAKPAPRL